jgi:hypothetical protein
MEMFGLLCALPAAFLVVGGYTQVLRLALPRIPRPKLIVWASAAVLAGIVLEWMLLGSLGTLRARTLIGPLFYPLHVVLFFLGLPALANVLVIEKGGTVFGWWFVVCLLCGILGFALVMVQIDVSETLCGIDGSSGPYGRP